MGDVIQISLIIIGCYVILIVSIIALKQNRKEFNNIILRCTNKTHGKVIGFITEDLPLFAKYRFTATTLLCQYIIDNSVIENKILENISYDYQDALELADKEVDIYYNPNDNKEFFVNSYPKENKMLNIKHYLFFFAMLLITLFYSYVFIETLLEFIF